MNGSPSLRTPGSGARVGSARGGGLSIDGRPLAAATLLWLAACAVPAAAQTAPSPGDHARSIELDGLSHAYALYVPPVLATPPPLVISLHGGGGDADDWEQTAQLKTAADTYGFVLMRPQGYGGTLGLVGRTWNAGSCCGPARKDAIDHVGAIDAMLDDAAQLVSFDPDRVLALGHSNGGMMVYRLGCELSGRITAVAANAAYLMDRFYERGDTRETAAPVFECAPQQPVALLHMHGLSDSCAPYAGGRPQTRELEPSYRPPVDDAIVAWRELHGCAVQPQQTFAAPGARCLSYGGCDGGVEVTLCTVDEAGHVWPGSSRYRPVVRASCGGATTHMLDANTEVWEFLMRQPRRTQQATVRP